MGEQGQNHIDAQMEREKYMNPPTKPPYVEKSTMPSQEKSFEQYVANQEKIKNKFKEQTIIDINENGKNEKYLIYRIYSNKNFQILQADQYNFQGIPKEGYLFTSYDGKIIKKVIFKIREYEIKPEIKWIYDENKKLKSVIVIFKPDESSKGKIENQEIKIEL